MTIAQELTDLQTINAAISGVVKAPVARPESVPTAHLPTLLLRPGAGAVAHSARGMVTTARTYEGLALVAGPLEGRAVDAAITAGEALMQSLVDTYSALIEDTPVLSTSGAVITAYRDSGDATQLIEYGDQRFVGFTFAIDLWS